ncbi:MAG: enolase C-terminal domain-like protein [Pseudomonadota bacterium]
MRLVNWSFHTCRLPYERPVQWSDVVEDAAEFLLLKLESDTGHTGLAEMTLKPTWTGASRRSLVAALEDMLLPLVKKSDVDDRTAVRRAMDAFPGNLAAKALLDNALWDLQAAASGQSLWQAWSGKGRVALTWVLTRQSPALMAAEAVAVQTKYGFKAIKVKGGQGLETDVRAMHELKAALGSSVRLYVDANGAYAQDKALVYVKAMADAGAEVVEDPCSLRPDAAFTALQQATKTPVLVDFGCESLRDAELFLDRGARAFSLKPGRFGLTDTREMARLSGKAGCKVVVGMFGESVLGTLPALSLASTLADDSLPAEVTWFLAMTEQSTTQTIEVRDGVAVLPAQAGCASLVDWDRLTPLPQ